LEDSEDKLVRLSVYVSEDKRARFKAACAIKKVSMNQVISDFLDKWLEENEKNPTSGISGGKGRGKGGKKD
jgi:hypothetical protein